MLNRKDIVHLKIVSFTGERWVGGQLSIFYLCKCRKKNRKWIVSDAYGNRWAVDRGRHDLDATRGNYGAPKYNSHPDQHGDQSQSLDQLAAGKWVWADDHGVGWCMSLETGGRLLYYHRTNQPACLTQRLATGGASQEATNCISAFFQSYYVTKSDSIS